MCRPIWRPMSKEPPLIKTMNPVFRLFERKKKRKKDQMGKWSLHLSVKTRGVWDYKDIGILRILESRSKNSDPLLGLTGFEALTKCVFKV